MGWPRLRNHFTTRTLTLPQLCSGQHLDETSGSAANAGGPSETQAEEELNRGWKMATSVVNSAAGDYEPQPTMAADYQDLKSLDVADESGKRFGRGLPPSQSSWRRICPTNRLVLILMGLCTILALSVGILGIQGVQLSRDQWGTQEALKSFNKTVSSGLSILQRKRNSTSWKLAALEKTLSTDNDKMEKVRKLIQGQLDTLQEDTRTFQCDLVELKSNGTKSGCCPKGWIIFQESCYWMSRSTMSWGSAKSDCQRKKAHLVALNSPEEARFVNQRRRPGHTWIGLTDVSGTWKWEDGTLYTLKQTDWSEGQPDHWYGHDLGGGEDCVEIYPSGYWNDNHCSRSFGWVCEMALKI
ncbi:asialoglycoprotein receptor 1-like [Elgaria multicarinata webbii]|uniref:asialoglycoprotein receptor 1-like n=1 Tax=Elgaria multicarinata webbii TaxID=159646 RepID=UPI002FCD0503